MKKPVLLIIAILLTVSFSYAQQPSLADRQERKSQLQLKTIAGKIEAIVPADSEKITKTELILVDEDKKKISFVVADGVLIRSSTAETVKLSQIKEGDLVRVVYHTNFSGVNVATMISLSN